MVPVLIVARLPAPMRDDEDLDARCRTALVEPAQIIEQPTSSAIGLRWG